jgi:HEAT repeat protein
MARSDDMHLSRTAVAALVLIRNEPIGPYILAYQDHTSTTNRAHAIGILMTLGPAAKEAVPILLADLQSTNGRVRLTAVIILRQVGSESAECVAPLIAAFDDENSTVRSSAVSALANFGELARPAIPAVVPKLGDTNASMRSSALMFILEAVPPEEFEALRPLVERATHDPDPAVAGLANALLEYKQGRHR